MCFCSIFSGGNARSVLGGSAEAGSDPSRPRPYEPGRCLSGRPTWKASPFEGARGAKRVRTVNEEGVVIDTININTVITTIGTYCAGGG